MRKSVATHSFFSIDLGQFRKNNVVIFQILLNGARWRSKCCWFTDIMLCFENDGDSSKQFIYPSIRSLM